MRKVFCQNLSVMLVGLVINSCSKPTDNNTDCISIHLHSGIIAFYPFDAGSVNDMSGNNYYLSNPTTASPGTDRDGNTNCAGHWEIKM
ncbi:MAG: hypothetical protein ABIQ31_09760 [Ferruginibacter sp.]